MHIIYESDKATECSLRNGCVMAFRGSVSFASKHYRRMAIFEKPPRAIWMCDEHAGRS